MATVTGLTAERMLEIEARAIVDGGLTGQELILVRQDGTLINVGSVQGDPGPMGPQGPQGIPGASSISAIPGEIRLWSGSSLPSPATYGKWVWADGAIYAIATYPIAAGHIASQWRTFGGVSDPGGSNFRVPDLRGLVPAGLDAMPGGTRANRMTRAIAIVIAGKTGVETHVITVSEMPNHDHGEGYHDHGGGAHNHGGGNHDHGGGNHGHALNYNGSYMLKTQGTATGFAGGGGDGLPETSANVAPSGNIITPQANIAMEANIPGQAVISPQGGGTAHENIQPTVMVPYIVKLDG